MLSKQISKYFSTKLFIKLGGVLCWSVSEWERGRVDELVSGFVSECEFGWGFEYVNECVSEWVSESTNQSVNQSVSQSVNQLVGQWLS